MFGREIFEGLGVQMMPRCPAGYEYGRCSLPYSTHSQKPSGQAGVLHWQSSVNYSNLIDTNPLHVSSRETPSPVCVEV